MYQKLSLFDKILNFIKAFITKFLIMPGQSHMLLHISSIPVLAF